jgi:hypothetical protein
MNTSLIEYFRCPERLIRFERKGPLSSTNGYFQLGQDVICYGGYFGQNPAETPNGGLRNALSDIAVRGGVTLLPFDPSQVAENLRCELYVGDWRSTMLMSALSKMYYFVRPILPVSIRKHIQKFHLKVRDNQAFPRWPVDCSVDNMLRQVLLLALRANGLPRIPFIWFWPDGAPSACIMTHDVETEMGRDYCSTLMDINSSFGINASFQIIPEQRYTVSPEFLDSIRNRGFEVAVHDLNHDGKLFRDHEQFIERAAKINDYGKEFRADGFRAGVLYRKQVWFDALKFSYDMSVPNVANLDPQRGGCCTVMPYFLGNILEIPVTATQDYTLFFILDSYSIDLWKQQIGLIMENHGLLSFIVHPDYIGNARESDIYKALLTYLVRLREEKGVWSTTPREVNRWWRQRAGMNLVERNGQWEIEGEGRERARVAYASEKDGRLAFSF